MGKVGYGETVEIPASAGEHKLWLRVDWLAGSPAMDVTLGEGQVAEFTCRPRPSPGLEVLWLMVESLFFRDRWILLEQT